MNVDDVIKAVELEMANIGFKNISHKEEGDHHTFSASTSVLQEAGLEEEISTNIANFEFATSDPVAMNNLIRQRVSSLRQAAEDRAWSHLRDMEMKKQALEIAKAEQQKENQRKATIDSQFKATLNKLRKK